MGKIVKGPWDIEVGGTILAGLETLAFTYDVKSTDYDSLQGQTNTVYGAHKAEVEATFLETDVPSLKAAIPQYWVATGSTLSSGDLITDTEGAIDIVPGLASTPRDMIIVSSKNPTGHVLRLNDVTSEISGVDMDANIRKIKVKFNCLPSQGQALMQFFKEGDVPGIS